MQSRKISKKPRKGAGETVAAAVESGTGAADRKPNSRASKSTAPNKEPKETGRAKHRNASGMERHGGAGAVDSPVIDPVGVMTPGAGADHLNSHLSRGPVERLAYSYWIARDYAHGHAEEDWQRAERELKEKR